MGVLMSEAIDMTVDCDLGGTFTLTVLVPTTSGIHWQ